MITRIQQDRKKCRDNNGTVYTIQDILRFKNQKIDTNVYVWGANRADKQSIRFKRGKSDSAGVSDSKAWKHMYTILEVIKHAKYRQYLKTVQVLTK